MSVCVYVTRGLGAICVCVYIIATEKGGDTFYIPPFFSFKFLLCFVKLDIII